jgi:hypothetical protein
MAPLVYNISDSTGDTSVYHRVLCDEIKYSDRNAISVKYSVSRGNYVISMSYAAGVSDYNLHELAYLQNFLNANFIKLNPVISLPKAMTSKTPEIAYDGNSIKLSIARQQEVKLRLFDMKGRKLATIFQGPASGENSFNLPRKGLAKQKAFINLEMGNTSVSKMITGN